jgi:tetratricopeptide (TPR) repeat protein
MTFYLASSVKVGMIVAESLDNRASTGATTESITTMKIIHSIASILIFSTSLFGSDDNVFTDITLPHPQYPQVIDVLNLSGPDDALAELQSSTAPDDSLAKNILEAELLAKAGKYAESEVVWLKCGQRANYLAALVAEKCFDLRIKKDDTEGAIVYLKQIRGGTNSRNNLSRYFKLASVYKLQGKYAEAEKWYKLVLKFEKKSSNADRARYGVATGKLATGDLKAALQGFRQFRLSMHSAVLYKDVVRLEEEVRKGTKFTHYSEAELDKMVKNLIKRSSYINALTTLASWRSIYPNSARQEDIDAHYIKVQFNKRQSTEVLEKCHKFYRDFPKSKHTFNVRHSELLTYQRMGATEKFVKLGADLRKGTYGGGSGSRRSVAILMGGYLVSIGQLSEGFIHYQDVYKTTGSSSTKRDMLWRIGLAAFRDKQYQRAVENFTFLLSLRPSGNLKQAAKYWLARSEGELGNNKKAIEHLIYLQQESPLSYYGIVARQSLEKLADKVDQVWLTDKLNKLTVAEFPKLDLPSSVQESDIFMSMSALASAGLSHETADFGRRLMRKYRGDKAVGLLVSRTLHATGNHGEAVRMIYDHFHNQLTKGYSGGPADFMRLYYPLPFWDEILAAANKNKLDPLLMYSIMRQESRFDPAARSAVGAIGLFQIMPYTAAELGPEIGLGKPDDKGLMNPATNSAIAARLARRLHRKFDSKAPIIASYNAGEGRVGAWWKAASEAGIDEDLFIDTIPYGQTRTFVKSVLTNYYNYKILAEKDAAEQQNATK